MTTLTIPIAVNSASLIAYNLKRLRLDAGLTQATLARRVSLARGVTGDDLSHSDKIVRVQLAQLEKGTGNPCVKWIDEVAAALNVEHAILLARPQEQSASPE